MRKKGNASTTIHQGQESWDCDQHPMILATRLMALTTGGNVGHRQIMQIGHLGHASNLIFTQQRSEMLVDHACSFSGKVLRVFLA